ncbi:ABC-2 type transport system permease protein [Prauserella shujinwangii]|uniref:ABC-2 type transport system permease protein n=1 Tax=Prauserella shujinwangii TaxID=1453103 RepID=A0A2T0LVA3_9PSEU|nr:ABC transporter permease [Prauserella shujinwangii]PRX47772.1 ABC-2 type transport system permease protein [Prauserella shujinwangii]
MNPTWNAIRSGLERGVIELRQTFTTAQDLWGYLFPAVVLLVVMTVMRDSEVPGTGFSLGAMALPSVLGMNVAYGGLVNIAQHLAVEREDGTLLRAKAVPGGMLGYLVGKIVGIAGAVLVSLVLVLVPGMFLFDGLALTGVGTWLGLLGVVALGLVATMPIGAALGSLFPNARSIGLLFLPIIGLIAISGIFYPVTSYPEWIQWIAQAFPIYWLGLGMRSALLPEALVAAEIGESWRHLETLAALGAWAVVGLAVAPIVLRRMARRESGSSVAARREKALQRVA